MKKNLKHSIVFILTVTTLILVTATSLAASKPISQAGDSGISVPVNPIINGKWSGLGMGIFSTPNTALFDSYVNDLLASGFTNLRVDIPTYMNAAWLAGSKAAVIRAVAKGANVTWGVSSNNGGGQTGYTITAENWPDFKQAILDAAAWAQDNGVYEFQLGNEEEFHQHRHPISITRTNNIATVTFTENHGFTAANPVTIRGAGTFNKYPTPTTITVTGPKTFTYMSTGTNGSASNPGGIEVYNLPDTTLEANLKSLATEVQAIFTRGNISYSIGSSTFLNQWHTLGRGDIDLLAFNVYTDYPYDWREDVDNMISWWGADHTYITEFGPSYTSLDSYSTDESVQAAAVSEMVEYIKASGITRAYNFCWNSGKFGVLKDDGTYRQLWNSFR